MKGPAKSLLEIATANGNASKCSSWRGVLYWVPFLLMDWKLK